MNTNLYSSARPEGRDAGSESRRATTNAADRQSSRAGSDPAAPRPQNGIEVRANEGGAAKRSGTRKALRILIAEDVPIIGMLLTETLEGMGHAVCAVATSEAETVSAAARCKPDLMIIDFGLSAGNGISAVETILSAGPIPHFFVSGDMLKVKALAPTAIVIQKPFREADLAQAIRGVIAAATAS
jgi:two-component system, response regulator PdtaR